MGANVVAFTFTEKPESRRQSYSSQNDQITLIYAAVGEQDDSVVRTYATTGSPATVTGLTGVLYRSEIGLNPEGFQLYTVEVTYTRLSVNAIPTGSYAFNFDTTGGTVHINCAKAHVASFPAGAPDHKGAINVKEDESVDGVDIIVPKLKFTLAFKFPTGVVTIAYVNSLAAITGTTNRYRFLGYNEGELLFLGATGSDGSASEMELSFNFEASANATGFTSGGITGISKWGHELLWHEFGSVVSSGKAATNATAVHIERVYDAADFGAVFKWNIYTG